MLQDKQSVYSYVFCLSTCLAAFVLAWQCTSFIGSTNLFLFFILVVTVNSFVNGFRPALLATLLLAVNAVYFFMIYHGGLLQNSMVVLSEIVFFILLSEFIIFVVERYRKSDSMREYKQKEKLLLQRFNKLEGENQRMQAEIKQRDEFLSIASHELKTPLTSMLLKLQLMLHNIRTVSLANFSVEKLLQMLESAEQQTHRLSRMINDLLNVSLITTGKLHVELGETDLNELVKEVVSEFTEKLESAQYKLILDADGKIMVRVDKLRIEQVMTNLISNAMKYGNGKPIFVSIAKHGGWAKIIVKDDGIGIAPESKERIFALFERGVSSNEYKGLGVGLYIARQIVSAHHGKISVESQLYHGSTFTVELPLHQNTAVGRQ